MKQLLRLTLLACSIISTGTIADVNCKVEKNNKILQRSAKDDAKVSNTLKRQTHEKIKAARQQYKKQLARLADLLCQAGDLGHMEEESDLTTRDLKDFMNNLSDIYVSVVDVITGRDDLKKEIAHLKTINGELLKTIHDLTTQADDFIQLEKELTHELNEMQAEKDDWLTRLGQLEVQASLLQNNLQSSQKEKIMMTHSLDEMYKKIVAQ